MIVFRLPSSVRPGIAGAEETLAGDGKHFTSDSLKGAYNMA